MVSALVSRLRGPALSPGQPDIVLCSWGIHLTLIVPLSTKCINEY